MFKNTVNRADH